MVKERMAVAEERPDAMVEAARKPRSQPIAAGRGTTNLALERKTGLRTSPPSLKRKRRLSSVITHRETAMLLLLPKAARLLGACRRASAGQVACKDQPRFSLASGVLASTLPERSLFALPKQQERKPQLQTAGLLQRYSAAFCLCYLQC
jgi:hypothetical protein